MRIKADDDYQATCGGWRRKTGFETWLVGSVAEANSLQPVTAVSSSVHKQTVTPTGFEQTQDSTGKTALPETSGAESGALLAIPALSMDSQDPELERVVKAWGALPETAKRMILAAVQAASPS